MKLQMQKKLLVMIVMSIFLFSVSQVYAKNLGIDLLTLVRNKAMSIVGMYTPKSSTDLSDKRVQVENDTLNYADNYIKGLEAEIKDYMDQQNKVAQDGLQQNYTDVKAQLDSVRQEAIDQAKQQAKQVIDSQYQEQQQILEDNLNKKIQDKFK